MLLLPLLSLSALWGFVLNLTVSDGWSLLRGDTLYRTVGVTSTDLGLELQAERERTLIKLTDGRPSVDLGEQRGRTDAALNTFREAIAEADVDLTDGLRTPLSTLQAELSRLPAIRTGVDGGFSTRMLGLNEYNRVLDAMYRFYDHLAPAPELAVYQQVAALQTMSNAHEFLLREHALIRAAQLDGRITEPEAAAFTEYASSRKFLHARGQASLDVELRRPYEELFKSEAFLTFATMEARIIRSGAPPPDTTSWNDATGKVIAQLDAISARTAAQLGGRAADAATATQVQIGVAGGVGLVAVLASIIISVRFGRRLGAELAGLRSAAVELSERRLPELIRRLSRGEEVDVAEEAKPIQVSGSAEISDVAGAFGAVQATAVRAAVGQAALRRGLGQVFLNLARRKQGLLHRQLSVLDAMQRRTHDPDQLEELFRLDHLTTRMRRHAESLIILSGSAPGRAWRKPVPAIDIVRAAIAEVEDYTRVDVASMPGSAIDGLAAADLTHLIAELVENATIYSPPDTAVQVRGDRVSNGYSVEVEDRGLGLQQEEYDAYNRMLSDPPEFDLADSDRLGLFVVAKLAQRHSIKVLLRRSPFGGTTAIVFVPDKLVSDQRELPAAADDGLPSLPSRTRRKALAVVSGTHAGLPRRVRQATLSSRKSSRESSQKSSRMSSRLQDGQPSEPEPERKNERSPDEVRDLFSAFQRGTQRAREEADEEGEA
ncbi:sensor histidine kinase [Nonomuraea sp. CA-218870]|uniref:sensor histidine kinase n=1 Tax=Nonomuraea sp. CA-218870 TaxID=3239998 RepID=UPI003D8EE737